ncbi:MAG: hypothetical protein HFE64_07020 [Lachnospiraceae bacterium]|nr:hypothetical protein [Lachnospiraceae bacterium]
MPLELILGAAAGGKTTRLQQEISQIAAEDAQRPLIYIVPEQTTLKVQQQLIQKMPGRSMLGTEILSFNRLAHRIFAETGMPPVKLLDDMGKCMVLYKLARDHQKELVYYGSSVGQQGFIGQLKLMMTELFQYRLDEEALQQLIEQQPQESILAAKLQDIALLWKYFKAYGEKQTIASEEVLDLLAGRIAQSALIKNACVFVDDFSGFTPQQYRILTGLALYAKKLTVAITITPAAYKAVQAAEDWRELPRQFFFTTQKTVWKLQQMSEQYRIPLRVSWQQEDRRSQQLQHVSRELCKTVPVPYEGEERRVCVQSAANQAQELQCVLHEILYLVREKGYAYRDMAVVAADIDRYAPALRRQLELYQIPGFIDEKADITGSPYVQWLHALGEWPESGFSGEALLALLKTGLTEIAREELDILENQALKENWRGAQRIFEALRMQEKQGLTEEEAALWKTPYCQLADQLEQFVKSTSGRHSAAEFTKAYQALARAQHIEEKLAEQAERLEQAGQLLKAMEYGRMFELIETLQERLCEAMGSVEMDIREYAAILDVGLSQSKMGQLPPSMDELLIADIGRSKLTGYRAVFFIGLQEGSFPKIGGTQSLLTQKERLQAGAELEIAQGEKENLMEQYYLLYAAAGKARERLYFFCSDGSSDGKAFGRSAIWKRLVRLAGSHAEGEKRKKVSRPLPFLYEEPSPFSGAAGKWLMAHGYERQLYLMEAGRMARQEKRLLSAGVARRLMDPAQRLLSITQLEQYARCPFSYYLRYGLYLKEREVPQVRSLEDGNVLHDILQEAGEYLLQALQEREAEQLAEQLAQLKQEEYPVYQTTGRYRYYWKKLTKTVARAVQILSEQTALGDFTPAAFEWRFGAGRAEEFSGAAVEVPLEDGRSVRLQGKIDRIDLWQDQDQRYVRIIDYKSGQTAYDPEQLYAGLQLQLPVYLEAGQAAYKAKPAGFFYFHLISNMPKSEGGAEAELKRLVLKNSRLDGLFLDDPQVIGHMDHGLEEDPLVVRAELTKSGAFHKRNQTASAAQFEQIKKFTHRKVRELAQDMSTGKIAQEPVQLGQKTACSFCEYRRACPFDERLPGYETRRAQKLSAEEFWERLAKEEQEK